MAMNLPLTSLDLAVATYFRRRADLMGITQAYVRSKLGISESTLGRYWRGEVPMGYTVVIGIAAALEITDFTQMQKDIRSIERELKKSNK